MAKKKAPRTSSSSARNATGGAVAQNDSSDGAGATSGGDECFEDSLAEIERIVVQLESGELGLAESLERYETAVRRLKTCHKLLEQAERRITILAGFDADGTPVTESFEGDEDPSLEGKQRSRSRRRGALGDGSQSGGQTGDSVDDEAGLF